MTITVVNEPLIPFQKFLGVPRFKNWTVMFSPSELATLQAARDILERVNDAGKRQFGQDDFYDVDDNWTRAEHGLTELLTDNPDGVWRYSI